MVGSNLVYGNELEFDWEVLFAQSLLLEKRTAETKSI